VSVSDDVRRIVAELADAPPEDSGALDVDSLTLVQIVEALEERFAIRISAREVVPENFASIAAIAAFITARAS
jgi:acyl carrier protein